MLFTGLETLGPFVNSADGGEKDFNVVLTRAYPRA